MSFLDTFLLNVRKHSDVYKLNVGTLKFLRNNSETYEEEKAAYEGGGVLTTKDMIRRHLNQLLC